MEIDRRGPHLFIGGSHDGECHELDALAVEVVRKVDQESSLRVADAAQEVGDDYATVALSQVVYENYFRHPVQVGARLVFVYALNMTDAEVAAALVGGYPIIKKE